MEAPEGFYYPCTPHLKIKNFLSPKVLAWLPSAVNRPSGSRFSEVLTIIRMKGAIAGLIPPGALRCKKQGQRVFLIAEGLESAAWT